MIVFVPARAFSDAHRRLADVLGPAEREILARNLASHVVTVAKGHGPTMVITSDPQVRRWAYDMEVDTWGEPARSGLDGAAETAAAVAARFGAAWAVLHGDLPYLVPEDLTAAAELASGGQTVVAPTRDGGTSLLVGSSPTFGFAYGPGSFHRHLAAADTPVVLIRRGLLLDLDTPADLRRFRDEAPVLLGPHRGA